LLSYKIHRYSQIFGKSFCRLKSHIGNYSQPCASDYFTTPSISPIVKYGRFLFMWKVDYKSIKQISARFLESKIYLGRGAVAPLMSGIPTRNVGTIKTLPPRSGGRGCKPRPAQKRYPRGAGDGVANPVRHKNVGTIKTLPPRSGGRGCKPRPAQHRNVTPAERGTGLQTPSGTVDLTGFFAGIPLLRKGTIILT
jgi:hypothetical protein